VLAGVGQGTLVLAVAAVAMSHFVVGRAKRLEAAKQEFNREIANLAR
jgi:hypothetical protein